MSISFKIALGCALLAAPTAALAQGGGAVPRDAWEQDGRPGPGYGRAFQLLLQHREQLALTDQQVDRLTAIGERLEAANLPLRERLAAERERFLARRRAELERMTPEERRAEFVRMRSQGRPPLPASMQPLADQMRQNIQGAMREAREVLTPEQRAQVRRMVRGSGGFGAGRARRGGWRGRRQP